MNTKITLTYRKHDLEIFADKAIHLVDIIDQMFEDMNRGLLLDYQVTVVVDDLNE